MQTLKTYNRTRILMVLGGLSTVSPFSIDMYLSAFPQMAEALQTSPARIALSLSSYFVGLAIGQIFYGPLLDRFGRKRPLCAGLMVYAIASLACLQTQTVTGLIVFRFIQALGGSAAQVACTAMVRDFFPVKESARIFSILMLIIGLSPLLAPTVGGRIASIFEWQAIFVVMGVGAFALLAAVVFLLPASRPADPSVSLRPIPILKEFGRILRTPAFLTYAVTGAFSFSGLFAYVAGSPTIFLEEFKVSTQTYEMIFALLSVGFIGGSQVNLLLSRRFNTETRFYGALFVQCILSALFCLFSFLGLLNFPLTLCFFFFLLHCIGISNPNAAALSLAPFEKNAGSASALLGFLQIGVGALASAAIGVFEAKTSFPIIGVLATASWTGFLWLSWNLRRGLQTAPV